MHKMYESIELDKNNFLPDIRFHVAKKCHHCEEDEPSTECYFYRHSRINNEMCFSDSAKYITSLMRLPWQLNLSYNRFKGQIIGIITHVSFDPQTWAIRLKSRALKNYKIGLNSESELKLLLSLGSIYLSFKLEPTKPTYDINVSNCVDSIKVDPDGYTSRDFKQKSNSKVVTLRKQGAKFKFSVREGKPDILLQVVLYIFLDKKGLPRPHKSSSLSDAIYRDRLPSGGVKKDLSSKYSRVKCTNSGIVHTRKHVFSKSIKSGVRFDEGESLLETLNLHKTRMQNINVETFFDCLTLTHWGCFFLREKRLLLYMKGFIINKNTSFEDQKKVLVVLSQIGRNPLGVELLSEHSDLLEIVLNKLDQKKMFSLDAFVFQFANLLVKNQKGRKLLASKRFDWNVKFISKKKINQTQDNYVAIHK